MKPIDEEIARAIDIALEEYRVLEHEKQVYIQGGLAVPSIVVLGTVTGISIVAQFQQWWILIALPLAQIGILAFSLFASAMSLRHAMYLAVVEKRIERLAGTKLIGWEMRGVENWPKFKVGGNTIENAVPNIGITIYFITLLFFIAIETAFSTKWYWNSGFPDGSENETWRHLATAIYIVLNAIGGIVLLVSFLKMPQWASKIHSNFAWEEISLKYVFDIYDGYLDPPELRISTNRSFSIYIRNLSARDRVFAIRSLNQSEILKPGQSCHIDIEFRPGTYECQCEIDGSCPTGESSKLVILPVGTH